MLPTDKSDVTCCHCLRPLYSSAAFAPERESYKNLQNQMPTRYAARKLCVSSAWRRNGELAKLRSPIFYVQFSGGSSRDI